jgi:hypothetical protein
MADLKDLPSGKKFTAFGMKKKLSAGTRTGNLSGLRDNQDAINSIAKKRQAAIRSGNYDSSRRRSDYREVLRSDSNLTQRDKKHVKELFEHWGTVPAAAKPSAKKAVVAKPASVKKESIRTAAIKKANIKRARLDRNSASANSPFSNKDPKAPKTFTRGVSGNFDAQSLSSGGGASAPSSSFNPPKLMR